MSVITSGVVGLAGVAAAVFSPGWTEERSETRRHKREAQRACRLVGHELRRLEIDLEAIAGRPVAFNPEIAGMLKMPEWQTYKADLAVMLPHPVWKATESTNTAIEKIGHALTISQESSFDGEEGVLRRAAGLARTAAAGLDGFELHRKEHGK